MIAVAVFVVASVCYGLWLLALSGQPTARDTARRHRRRQLGGASGAGAGAAGADSPYVVFLLPCLNEASVIGASIDRLLALPYDRFTVMVIDDGSDDTTAAVVLGYDNPRVKLLRRVLPEARQGKGEALNAAIRHLRTGPLLDGISPDQVVVVVVDADGRMENHALQAVLPLFEDPAVGAVQIGVRINNRASSRLARMQDIEFVTYTDVFQQGRRHLGSVGLGGNGQFMRLSALYSLGDTPWSRSLTEDLDLGVRFLAAGWDTDFCRSAAVHQQGVTELRRLIKQRTRWFQGHLQSWSLIPVVARDIPGSARTDLIYHLTSPVLLLMSSFLTAAFLIGLLGTAIVLVTGQGGPSWWLVSAYLLSFGPSLIYGRTYWLRERESGAGRWRVLGWSHLYAVYSLMWYFPGWGAVWRTLRRETGWTKTTREAEPTDDAIAHARITPSSPPSPAPRPRTRRRPLRAP